MRSRALRGTAVYWPLRDERADQGMEKQVCWRDTEQGGMWTLGQPGDVGGPALHGHWDLDFVLSTKGYTEGRRPCLRYF